MLLSSIDSNAVIKAHAFVPASRWRDRRRQLGQPTREQDSCRTFQYREHEGLR